MVPAMARPRWPRRGWDTRGGSPNADKAVSDAAQTLYFDQFEKLMAN